MLAVVERAINEELRWPRSMVKRLEERRPGSGLNWAVGRLRRWIEETKPDGKEELLRLILAAEDIGLSASNSTALGEESRRIWYLHLQDVYPQRAVSRIYEALTLIACGNRDGYIQSLATAVFIAASRESFTDEMFRDLQESFRTLIDSETNRMGSSQLE